MTVRELGDSLGISRQLALYHVKKGVASGELVMLLQPCPNNGGLQFQVWAPTEIARHFARLLPMSERVDAALAVASAS